MDDNRDFMSQNKTVLLQRFHMKNSGFILAGAGAFH